MGFELIERYLADLLPAGPNLRRGIGDDCAVLAVPAGHELAVSIDTLNAGVHFPADTAPGDVYWRNTAEFWGQVRAYWQRAMSDDERIRLKPEVDGQKLFQPLFERAQEIADGKSFTAEENRVYVEKTIDAFRADSEGEGSTEY